MDQEQDRLDPDAYDAALRQLEALSGKLGSAAWLAEIAAARLAREEGRTSDAARLLKRALESFRADAEQLGEAAIPLARLVAREVRALDRARATPAGSPAPADGIEPAALARLVELGKRLAGEDDPDQVLRVLLHEAIEITGTERGFVVLVRDGNMEFALAENLEGSEVERPSFEVSRTLVRGVIAKKEPLLLSLPQEADPTPVSFSLVEIGARSVACVPIVHREAVLGVLYLDGHNPGHSFGRGMERLLALFAAQAGATLENARTHRARALALEAAEENLRRHRSEGERRSGYGELVGSSDEMQEVYGKLDRFVATEMPVLILGETGTGKELVARILHAGGSRASREFVAVNCAGLAESLLESELFGHERGAFTGADRAKPGLFELAHRGTLFLDEVGDMSLRMQAEFFRALQAGEVRRVGGRETIRVDVRVIAATHRDLEQLIARGEFRQDLYYRLNVLALRLPALRERPEDLPALLAHFLERLAPAGRPAPRIQERALRRLAAHPWPGNVRELQNVARRLLVLDVEEIQERHLPHELTAALPRGHLRAGSLRRAEDEAVRRALEAARGNKAEAARLLGVDRKTLYAKLRRLQASGTGGRG